MTERNKIESNSVETKPDKSQSLKDPARRKVLKGAGAAVLGASLLGFTHQAQGKAAKLPPEFSAPAETLKPGAHDSDMYMTSTSVTKEKKNVTSWIGRNTAGVAVGIIQGRAVLPMIPGHIGNGTTFPFPILYREITHPNIYAIMAEDPTKEPEWIDACAKAARWLELQGVRAIVGNCGFFATYQHHIQEKIDTPFFSSSLVQLPIILTCLPKKKKVGVITANGPLLGVCPALKYCGVTAQDEKERIVIQSAEGPEFDKVVGQTGGPFDVFKLEQEIVKAAETVVKRDPNIGAFLLECTELSAAAHAVQNAVRLPVYDYCTLIRFIQDGAVARQYTGWM